MLTRVEFCYNYMHCFNYIDDPSVLLEAETEFLNQMFGDQNEICIDKENMPPNTPTPGKPCNKKIRRQSRSPQSQRVLLNKNQKILSDQKQKKTKKVYSKD